jgi:DNA-binding response OmpR family regulator
MNWKNEMQNATAKILLVEDDERIRRELLDALRASGFDVDVSVQAHHARLALERDYDLVLLDLGLPDGNGLDLCRELRAAGRSLPVIILTARDAPEQRVRGLDVGADDYVVKPFHLPELVARVRSVLRRVGRTVGPGRAQWKDLCADPESRTARREERTLDLTRREFDLLLFFLRFPGRTWTRDQLLDRVWGTTYRGDSRTVDLHVRRLRAKIEDDPSDPHYLNTVWGVGYRMGDSP